MVPVTVYGSLQINPPKQLELNPGRIRVRFGAPLQPAGAGVQQREALMAEVRTAIAAGLEC